MRPWILVCRRVVNCVLALAVCAQPILAQHCSCQSPQPTASKIVEDCDGPNCCPNTSNLCRHHDDSHAGRPQVSQVGGSNCDFVGIGLCPCGCPRDCGCQLRHAPTPAVPHKAEMRVAKQHQDAAGASRSHTSAPLVACYAIEIGPPRSAVTLCAVLCRFTI